jgi:hypothetical protein
MAGYHTVKQGEHVSGIADQYGFPKFSRIWSDPNNADLVQQRGNPNVLNAGDNLYIPDHELQEFSRPTDQRHKFVLSADPLQLFLVLKNIYGAPIANCPCKLQVGLSQYALTSDGNGMIEQKIPKDAINASLIINDEVQVHGQSVPIDRQFDLKIGYLDPVDTASGQQTRLTNLGYYRGPQSPTDSDELDSAVEEFQCDNGLTVDGICGPQTQAALLKVHGC